MISRILKFEFLASVIVHLCFIALFSQGFYEQSAYSMASQVIEISLEMIPETPVAEAAIEIPLKKEEFTKVLVQKKQIQKKLNQVKPKIQEVQNKPASENKDAEKRGRLASKGKVKFDTKAKPDYLRNPPPAYPWQSKRNREQGMVLLKVRIASDGKVKDIKLQKSSGFYRLDAAALDSVSKWKFKAARFAGITVESDALVPVRFVLR